MASRSTFPLTLAAMALTAATAPGCTCYASNEDLARLEKPVRARVVQTDNYGVDLGAAAGGHIGIIVPVPDKKTHYKLVLETTPPFEWPLDDCGAVTKLAGDEVGQRLAYGCGAERWLVVYLGHKGRAFPSSAPIKGATVDWAKVPSFEAEAPALLRQYAPKQATLLDALLDETIERGGDEALEALVAATIDAPYGEDQSTESRGAEDFGCAEKKRGWTRAFERLGAERQARIRKKLSDTLRSPVVGTPWQQMRRALAFVDIDDPAFYDTLEARAAEYVAEAPKMDAAAATLVLLRLSAHRPARAGELGCALYEKLSNLAASPGQNLLREAALLAVAHAKTACPAVVSDLRAWACEDVWLCGEEGSERLCEASALKEHTESVIAQPLAATRLATCAESEPFARSFAAAALAQGPLPKEVALAQKRLLYPIENEGPSCGDGRDKEPCHCGVTAKDRYEACKLPPKVFSVEQGYCTLVVDDRAGKLRFVQRESFPKPVDSGDAGASKEAGAGGDAGAGKDAGVGASE